MDAYVTEEQQLEAIKKWFQKYGNLLSWGFLIVVSIACSIFYWRHHQEILRQQASEHYILLMNGLDQQDSTTTKSEAQILLNQYPTSTYATLSSYVLALNAIKDNDLTQAEKNLKWILDHSQQADFRAIAQIRLMRLYIAQNKLDQAMSLYNEKIAGDFITLMEELKGDILLERKEVEAARKSYEKAYVSALEEGMYGPLLKLKMEALGIAIPENATPTDKVEEKEAVKS